MYKSAVDGGKDKSRNRFIFFPLRNLSNFPRVKSNTYLTNDHWKCQRTARTSKSRPLRLRRSTMLVVPSHSKVERGGAGWRTPHLCEYQFPVLLPCIERNVWLTWGLQWIVFLRRNDVLVVFVYCSYSKCSGSQCSHWHVNLCWWSRSASGWYVGNSKRKYLWSSW